MGANDNNTDIGAAYSFEEHANTMEVDDPLTPPTSDVCADLEVHWNSARIGDNSPDVMEYVPGPWAEGLGRWRLLGQDNNDDDYVLR